MTGPPTQAALLVSACITLCKSQPEKSEASSPADVRRFGHAINTDEVFGTHTANFPRSAALRLLPTCETPSASSAAAFCATARAIAPPPRPAFHPRCGRDACAAARFDRMISRPGLFFAVLFGLSLHGLFSGNHKRFSVHTTTPCAGTAIMPHEFPLA